MDDRMIQLESTVMHLQHDLDQISQVVLDQQKQIQELKRQLEHWELKFQAPQPDLPPILEDKPPHY